MAAGKNLNEGVEEKNEKGGKEKWKSAAKNGLLSVTSICCCGIKLTTLFSSKAKTLKKNMLYGNIYPCNK